MSVTENAIFLGTVAVLLAGIAVALGGVIDRVGAIARRRRKPGRRRAAAASRDLVTSGAEFTVGVSDHLACSEAIEKMDEALESRNSAAAARLWLSAQRAARSDQHWENLVAVGAARLRVAAITGGRKEAEAKARELYLLALFRARQHGSLDGLLRIAESFAALGEYRVADQTLRIAQIFATGAEDSQRVTTRRVILRKLTPTGTDGAVAMPAC